MNFGIVVTDQNQSRIAADLMREALQRDWQVRCFLTDDGVNMIRDHLFVEMAQHNNVHLSVCEHSVERYCQDTDLEALADVLVVGGQYQDAELVRNCDKVLVF